MYIINNCYYICAVSRNETQELINRGATASCGPQNLKESSRALLLNYKVYSHAYVKIAVALRYVRNSIGGNEFSFSPIRSSPLSAVRKPIPQRMTDYAFIYLSEKSLILLTQKKENKNEKNNFLGSSFGYGCYRCY